VFRIARCPLEVAEALSEWLFGNLKTVVMTSATLSVGRRFEYLSNRLGLDLVKDKTVENHILDSPFDFEKQAVLAIPTDIVQPDDKGFLDEVVKHVRAALRITGGHAFVLFTSFYALDYVHRRLEAEAREMGILALKQGAATRTRLLDQFRDAPSSVLFATDSFWEGVDVAGDALQCVILPKLPFRVPTEPIQEARAEAIEAAGGDSFMDYSVPQAVIKFRQGLGRLIRRKTDRGAVLVLDRRIITKRYGRVFLESLPDMRVVQGPSRGVYGALDRFFKEKNGEVND
jgi:ATP-dependent DNA helicase DinG